MDSFQRTDTAHAIFQDEFKCSALKKCLLDLMRLKQSYKCHNHATLTISGQIWCSVEVKTQRTLARTKHEEDSFPQLYTPLTTDL